MTGKILSIFVATAVGPNPPPAGGYSTWNPMCQVQEAVLLEQRGILGDRWLDVTEFKISKEHTKPFPHKRQISLIATEDIEIIKQSFPVEAIDLRRNILTEGLPVNTLVGVKFKIGEAILKGVGLCHACSHIELVNQMPGLATIMYSRGGLRAEILQGGIIKQEDEICLLL